MPLAFVRDGSRDRNGFLDRFDQSFGFGFSLAPVASVYPLFPFTSLDEGEGEGAPGAGTEVPAAADGPPGSDERAEEIRDPSSA